MTPTMLIVRFSTIGALCGYGWIGNWICRFLYVSYVNFTES